MNKKINRLGELLMKFKKVIILLIAFAVLSLSLYGCNNSNTSNITTPADTGKEIVVGVSVMDGSNPYYLNLVNGIKEEAAKLGIRVIVKDAKSNSQTQAKDIEDLIAEKPSAIIVAAFESKKIETTLLKAKKAGIKIVAQSTKVENCDTYVSADEWEMGHMLGEYVGKWIRDHMNGTTEYAIINYPAINELANREKGIKDGIREFAPNAKLISTALGASNQEEAYKAGINILKNYPKVKVIVGINDNAALGAFKAYSDNNKISKDMLFGGIDATSDAAALIKSGTAYRCTVDTIPKFNGNLDMIFALKLLKGQTVSERYKITTKLITK